MWYSWSAHKTTPKKCIALFFRQILHPNLHVTSLKAYYCSHTNRLTQSTVKTTAINQFIDNIIPTCFDFEFLFQGKYILFFIHQTLLVNFALLSSWNPCRTKCLKIRWWSHVLKTRKCVARPWRRDFLLWVQSLSWRECSDRR